MCHPDDRREEGPPALNRGIAGLTAHEVGHTLRLVVSEFDGAKHLPVVRLKKAA